MTIKDVNTETQSSEDQTAAAAEVDTNAEGTTPGAEDKQGETSSDNDYDNLFDDDKKTVPYKVFSERNKKLRDAEKKIKNSDKEFATRLQKREAELYAEFQYNNQKAQPKEDEYADMFEDDVTKVTKQYETKISNLEGKLNQVVEKLTGIEQGNQDKSLKRKITSLKEIYPNLDEEHVYAIKKINPDYDIEECAEYSHKKWESKVQGMYKKLINEKKEAAKQRVNTEDSISSFAVKKKPGSSAEAADMVREYLAQTGG